MSIFAARAPRPPGARGMLRNLLRRLARVIEKQSQARIRHAVPNYQLRRERREMLQLKRAVRPNDSAKP